MLFYMLMIGPKNPLSIVNLAERITFPVFLSKLLKSGKVFLKVIRAKVQTEDEQEDKKSK